MNVNQIDKMRKLQDKLINRFCTEDNLKNSLLLMEAAEAIGNLLVSRYEWISVEDRLPTQDEYLTHHNDGLDTLKRIIIAYMTDTVEYTIGCYDGYKWMNQLGNRVVKDVIAWKPFEMYQAPKKKGGNE